MSGEWGDGPKPSWWDKSINDPHTEEEWADFMRAIAKATEGLGGKVSVTIARPIEPRGGTE